jgi:hypothetical protein
MSFDHEIFITVRGGVIEEIENIPKGIIVRVYDYDCTPESDVEEDITGDEFVESVHVGTDESDNLKLIRCTLKFLEEGGMDQLKELVATAKLLGATDAQ